MNSQEDIIGRFHAALPELRQWMDDLRDSYANQAKAVSSLGFRRLTRCFPEELLQRARVVTVQRVPFPPIERYGLPELAGMQLLPLAGIAFDDMIFLQQGQSSESLHFHELVHVVQWARLGIDRFLLAYGVGLLLFGYDQSPLEQMAYTLQESFERGALPPDLVRIIEARTDAVWAQAAPLVQGGRSSA